MESGVHYVSLLNKLEAESAENNRSQFESKKSLFH